jgi:hypothetical protein
MPTTKTERRFYPNGQLEWEGTFVDGRPHGIQRRWYPNGVLSDETPLQDGNYEGIGKHWNNKGELVGTWEVRNGRGVFRMWHENGVLSGELPYLDGNWTGRQRVWFEDGELVTQVFWLRGRKVSRKKYLEACKTDPSLPNYENEPKVESWETKMKRLVKRGKPAPEPPRISTSAAGLLEEFLADPTRREALDWLQEVAESETRSLGEIPSWKESLALVEEAYAENVTELFVVKVVDCGDGLQNTGTLMARLPAKGKKRKKALAWCNEQNGFQGFDPEEDGGQKWMIVQLD